MKGLMGWLALVLLVGGCKADKESEADPTPEPRALVAPERVLGIPNVDDDLEVGGVDFYAEHAEDEDMSLLTITPSDLPGTQLVQFQLRLEGPVEHMRVWHEGEILLDATQQEATLPWASDPLELRVEFARTMLHGTLHISERSATGEDHHPTDIALETGPLLLNHHLQPTEKVFMMGPLREAGFSNYSMFNDIEDVLGSMFVAVPPARYSYDVWVQDEIQHGYATAPDQRMDVIVDSIRDRGLDGMADEMLLGPELGVVTLGNGIGNTLDSFGNLEVSPPVDGYPFGRIYYGGRRGTLLPVANELFAFLRDQAIQEPFLVDTLWLCVAHVDEFMTFVPDATAPRGFRFVYSDVDLAYELLDEASPTMSLPMYASNWSHGYANAGAIANDNGLRNFNYNMRDMYLLPILDQMIEELGLLEEEVVPFPGLFEQAPGCGGTAAALIPGMLNLLQVNLEDGGSHSFLADPFFRSDLNDQSSDAFIQAAEALMPEELNLHFVDDFDVYHLGLGEVHCGTNDIRTPTADWWDLQSDTGAM